MDLKRVEHRIDRLSPTLSIWLRLLKKRLHHDMTLRLIRRLAQPGDEVLDIGAYRGVNTLELARRVGGQGRVWAIEPFPPNAAALERVMARRSNVVVCPWAASDRVGRRKLTVPVYGGRDIGALATMGEVGVSSQVVEIDVRTVDGLLDSRNTSDRPVTFIRCDVVGHEAAVLAGAARTLETYRPAVLVEIEQRHQSSPIGDTFERMAEYGYEAYFIRASSLMPLSVFDLERDQLSMVPEGFVPYSMPHDYVHYFLFVRSGTDLTGIVSG